MNGYTLDKQVLENRMRTVEKEIQTLEQSLQKFRNEAGVDGSKSDDAYYIIVSYERAISELKSLLRRDFDAI